MPAPEASVTAPEVSVPAPEVELLISELGHELLELPALAGGAAFPAFTLGCALRRASGFSVSKVGGVNDLAVAFG